MKPKQPEKSSKIGKNSSPVLVTPVKIPYELRIDGGSPEVTYKPDRKIPPT